MCANTSRGTLASAWTFFLIVILASLSGNAWAQEPGQVRMPLVDFQELTARAAAKKKPDSPPPLAATISKAEVTVQVSQEPGRAAQVQAVLTVHQLNEQWTAVPLLPMGTALNSASENGQAIALGEMGGQLVWSVKQPGTHQLLLKYAVPVIEAKSGRSLHLPVPVAAALNLTATLPGNGLKVSVVPASGFEVSESGPQSIIKASIPQAAGVQINWAVPAQQSALVLASEYRGLLKDGVVSWKADIMVKVLSAGPVILPMLASKVALASARVDDQDAMVREMDGKLAVQLQGVGRHRVSLRFQTPVTSQGGPPGTGLWLPRPPLASFSLDLPGNKELSVKPEAGISAQRVAGRTRAQVNLPPADRVHFSWSEALPAAIQEQVQANAEVYHVVEAQEGVLKVSALVAFLVTRGRSNVLKARLAPGVAVNQVSGEGVADWRVTGKGDSQELAIYLDRHLDGELRYRVDYEHLLGTSEPSDDAPVDIPLLRPVDTNRQRGMVALLSGSELSMRPHGNSGMNKVGENQLPAWVRQTTRRTVAHTYKYIDPDSSLAVQLAPPERQQGKFDAVVDTLYSVGDGVMKASSSVEIAIKSGRLMELSMALPEGVNLVGVTAPSLRDHEVLGGDSAGQRTLRLMFTQELEGTLRVEVSFERVLAGGQEKLVIPALHVPGADMEQGRMAVEALTAVEVQTAAAERVLPLDVEELPRQLTLRTTNPILLAYKYVHAEPAFRLVLEIRHHAEMQVQVAAIDRADYQTLFTGHGLALTRARYQLRNRRKQFLKVLLPEGSQLWSAGLNGRPVKPAQSGEKSVVLVPLVNSASGFQVEIVYATSIAPLGFAGWIDGLLPVPDIVETSSSWDVFLPSELTYGQPDSNMSLVALDETADFGMDRTADLQAALAGHEASSGQVPKLNSERTVAKRSAGVLPLRIEVPRKGVHLRFEKLFANRGDERSQFTVRYASPVAGSAGGLALGLGVFALLFMMGRSLGRTSHRPTQNSVPVLVASLVVLLLGMLGLAFLSASLWWALAGALGAGLVTGGRMLLAKPTASVQEQPGE